MSYTPHFRWPGVPVVMGCWYKDGTYDNSFSMGYLNLRGGDLKKPFLGGPKFRGDLKSKGELGPLRVP